jgi:nitrogen fixation protein FixH
VKQLLVLVTFIGMAAVIGAIVVGKSTFDGTVVDNPYEKGLVWDAEQKERESSGWRVDMQPPSPTVGRNELHIHVRDGAGKPLASEVMLTVSRPSSKRYDRQYTALLTEKGSYAVQVDLPLYGYWDLVIRVTAQNKTILFHRTVFAEQGT